MCACAGSGARTDSGQTAALKHPTAALPVLRREDILWLGRVTFGIDSESVADYQRFGRERFLDRQLSARDTTLPPPIAAQINLLEVSHSDPEKWLADLNARYKSINAMSDGPDK